MDRTAVLKAIADENRMKIVTLLLSNNHCVGALAKKLNISEAAVSQHLKVLREAGLISGEKRGYFMHYSVNRGLLHELAREIDALADIEQKSCNMSEGDGCSSHLGGCRHHGHCCSDEVKEFCHGRHGDKAVGKSEE